MDKDNPPSGLVTVQGGELSLISLRCEVGEANLASRAIRVFNCVGINMPGEDSVVHTCSYRRLPKTRTCFRRVLNSEYRVWFKRRLFIWL